MKHGKRPTLQQKLIIKKSGFNPNNWLVIKNLPGELHIGHRETGRLKVIPVERR